MADNDLQERLRESAKAFDGLLSLIPAQEYYGEDTSDQWKRKKQSKAEKKAAKLGKLDPDSEKNRTAKEVMDERARNKRKLEEIEMDSEKENGDVDGSDNFEIDGIEKEQPLKRQKTTTPGDPAEDYAEASAEKLSAKQKNQLLKKQKKLEKKVKKEEKLKPKRRQKEGNDSEEAQREPVPESASEPKDSKTSKPHPSTEGNDDATTHGDELRPLDLPGLDAKDEDAQSESTSPSSQADSPIFDTRSPSNKDSAEPVSTTTSIASAVPPSEKPKHAKLPSGSTDAFRARLAARIEELRKARKADGEEGRPARTRQELIESRRLKQAQRRAHKKEVRRLAKEEEDRKREEALASARTSPGSFMSPLNGLGSDLDDGGANHFAFGRVAFADGAQMSHDLSYVKDKAKKKGPSDPKTALAKLEAQKKRIAGLDEDKRKEVLEKETWLAARRRAEGEKIRDDEAMLKKAVKRKEQKKKKSEREWNERKAGVEKAMKERQKKREDNLRKRREEKMLGRFGRKKGGKKGRPGFEGTGLGGSGKRK